MTAMTTITPTAGAKMMYLIKRRADASREELVVHWFANHMPIVIAGQAAQAERGKLHASRYIATLFDADASGNHPWDGVAQIWWPQPLSAPKEPFGVVPTDTFQQKAEPYVPWATTEYVVIDPSSALSIEPLTLNEPFPTTRSGFLKITFLVQAKADTDFDAFFRHWLDVHAPNVRAVMESIGGFGYVVSHSQQPQQEPYAGMAELYFEDLASWQRFSEAIRPDGMEQWLSDDGLVVLHAHTEMIGIA